MVFWIRNPSRQHQSAFIAQNQRQHVNIKRLNGSVANKLQNSEMQITYDASQTTSFQPGEC